VYSNASSALSILRSQGHRITSLVLSYSFWLISVRFLLYRSSSSSFL
jgi:hypothetical protein